MHLYLSTSKKESRRQGQGQGQMQGQEQRAGQTGCQAAVAAHHGSAGRVRVSRWLEAISAAWRLANCEKRRSTHHWSGSPSCRAAATVQHKSSIYTYIYECRGVTRFMVTLRINQCECICVPRVPPVSQCTLWFVSFFLSLLCVLVCACVCLCVCTSVRRPCTLTS